MSKQQQDYIHIEEDTVSESSTSKVVQLRNMAYSRPLSSTPRPITRTELLESLMPLSRNPWSNVPTLLTDSSSQSSPKIPSPPQSVMATSPSSSPSSSSPSPPSSQK
ncbi:hypothetical protein BGZ65_000737 [Modicella reniformis]|uniref:Uncharacterized protein n=1 Tax=Modicella reniformis TaxID=1440133 RepID=A0A9P6M173_9FUNG|nr:hypothetical protein BGZ65_000737 [Modicella reniformis]